MCSAACRRTRPTRRSSGRPRTAGAAGDGRLRAAAPRHRLPLRRPGGARGQIGGRHRGDHRQLLHGALDHQPAIAARGGDDAAGGAFALRAQRRAGAVRVPRGQAGQGRPARSKRSAKPGDKRPAWQQALASARLPLYDVHWTPAVVVEKPRRQEGRGLARRPGRRPHPAALDRQRRRAAQARALRRGARARDRGQGQERPRAPNCGCARWCRARWWCWRTRPAASWP